MKKDLVIVIFGSTGDLTFRKLVPAIEKLNNDEEITQNFELISIGRRDFTNNDYYNFLKERNSDINIDSISKYTKYLKMELTDAADYVILNDYLKEITHENSRIIYYLAVAPEFFIPISKALSKGTLLEKGNKNHSVIFEKPFGSNLKTAKEINRELWKHIVEEQIYRIDHYLAKEMIQNIMILRFTNKIFQKVWNRDAIKSIRIYAKEELGILDRANFYDQSGALKDMVQSHLLQVLSLILMEEPKSMHSTDVKNAKLEVLKALHFDQKELILGQYASYLEEEGIPSDSLTETFVFMKTYVNSKRFKDVPVYLLTGKKLDRKSSKIIIEFKETDAQKNWGIKTDTNKLHIEFAPNDTINIILNSKTPGLIDVAEPVNLSYYNAHGSDGYEKLILDAINHHKTLFTRWDEIEYSWKFIDQVKGLDKQLLVYENYQDIVDEIIKLTK